MKFNRTKLKYALIALVVAGASVLVLEITNRTHFFHNKLVSSTIPETSQQSRPSEETKPAQSDNKGSSSSNTPKPTEKTDNFPVNGAVLTAPSGSFVSNHRVDLGNSQTTSQESLCTSTVGAQCFITLKLGSIVKTLEAKTIGSSGTVSWIWDIKTAGLTTGTWEVTATASLNGQTKSTTDLQSLEIK